MIHYLRLLLFFLCGTPFITSSVRPKIRVIFYTNVHSYCDRDYKISVSPPSPFHPACVKQNLKLNKILFLQLHNIFLLESQYLKLYNINVSSPHQTCTTTTTAVYLNYSNSHFFNSKITASFCY